MPTNESRAKVRRRPVNFPSTVDTARAPSQPSSVSGNVSQDGESLPSRHDQQLRVPTWDSSSQASTAGNKSSVGSPGFERRTSTSFSTAATEPSLANSGKLRKLGPLHAHLETINKYEPGRAATEIWTACVLEFGNTVADDAEHSDDGPENNNLWNFWERMANIADFLVTAKYLTDAFDMHYLCFVEIFADTSRRLSHWEPTATSDDHYDQDRKTSEVIAGTPAVLQLLTRAVIGAARSCISAAHSKLARVMLDAAHSILLVLRHTKYPTRVRAVLILFDIYRNTLMDVWNPQNTPVSPESFNSSPISPKSSRLDQEFSLDDLVWYIHPTLLNREYFVLSTHLLNLSKYQQSWLSLPARTTAWDRPLAQFVRNLAISSKTNQAWVELVKTHTTLEAYEFIDAYLREAKAFIQGCINTIFEAQAVLNESFAVEAQSSHIVSRDDLNEARLTLYWFLVGRRKFLEGQSISNDQTGASSLPRFTHSDNNNPATSEALFLLSSFIFGFCTPVPLPKSLPSIAEYAMDRLKQIMKWPAGFVWHFLQHTVSFASKLHADGDFVQDRIQRRHVDNVIHGNEYTEMADAGVHMAVELHPQPLPEFIVHSPTSAPDTPTKAERKSHSHLRHRSKVTFAESTSASSTPTTSPAKTAKRRWYTRLSMSRIEEALQSTTSKPNTPVSTKPKSSSVPAAAKDIIFTYKASRKSIGSANETGGTSHNSSKVNVAADDFPGDYMAIAPLMSSPTNANDTGEGDGEISVVPDCDFQHTQTAFTLSSLNSLKKIDSVVSTTEILLPEIRPPFIVLH